MKMDDPAIQTQINGAVQREPYPLHPDSRIVTGKGRQAGDNVTQLSLLQLTVFISILAVWKRLQNNCTEKVEVKNTGPCCLRGRGQLLSFFCERKTLWEDDWKVNLTTPKSTGRRVTQEALNILKWKGSQHCVKLLHNYVTFYTMKATAQA